MKICRVKNDMNKETQDSLIGNVENVQRDPSDCHEDSSKNGTGDQGMLNMKSTWNEGILSDLHFADDPFVINIKTEEII